MGKHDCNLCPEELRFKCGGWCPGKTSQMLDQIEAAHREALIFSRSQIAVVEAKGKIVCAGGWRARKSTIFRQFCAAHPEAIRLRPVRLPYHRPRIKVLWYGSRQLWNTVKKGAEG